MTAPAQSGSRAFWLVVAAASALALYQYATLFPFVIDDAYIVLRYARNLVTTGQLVFNAGERVSALTSPLHTLLAAGLYALMGEKTLLAYKLLCIGCLVASVVLLLRAFRGGVGALALTLALLVTAPSVVLWTFGGLETPLLFLVVAGFTALIQHRLDGGGRLDRVSLVCLHLLAAVAFLIRYDSVCFFAPALLLCWRHRDGWKSVGLSVYLAALPCLAWFSFAFEYFGDVLPTSFYVKTPSYGLREIAMTGLYELLWLTLLGVAPLLGAALFRRWRRREWSIEPQGLILLVGLAGTWLYGLGMAQKHMMFGFRHGVPYLPAAASLLLLELRRWDLRPAPVAAFLIGLLVVHAVHTQRMLDVSVNGYWRWSPFSEAGARNLMDMVGVWKTVAHDMQAHWSQQGRDRPLRVFTYVGGVVPYELPDAYVFEELISARRSRCAKASEIEAAADYVHAILTPQNVNSPYYNAIARNPERLLISEQSIQIGGDLRRVQVYYNPSPTLLSLPARFNEACLPAKAAAQ